MIDTIPTKADLDAMTWKDLKQLARDNQVPIVKRRRTIITAELAQVLKCPEAVLPAEPVDEDAETWLHYPTGVQRGKGQWMASVAAHVPTTIFVYNAAGSHACSFFAFNNGIKMDHRKHARLFVDLME